jgi:NAD(P)-dependent dehydrogenase (short-subunit alcohol dehydrogenase family)
VSNAARQSRKDDLEQMTDEELERTFRTNVFAHFRLMRR